MTTPSLTRPQVIVVGAGPVGLVTASELALAGVSVRVLERLREASPTIKAGSINVASAEILDRRGLLPDLHAAQRRRFEQITAFARDTGGGTAQHRARAHSDDGRPRFPANGHFAAMLFRPDLVNQDDPLLQSHLAAVAGTVVAQDDVERILAAYAARLGVEVTRGVAVTGVAQDTHGVRLDTSTGPLHADWVVAADGGRSTIRKQCGIGFPGTDAEITGYQAIADLEGAEQLKPGWTWTPTGVYSHGPIPGRILTVQFTGAPADRDAPVRERELQDSIRLVTGQDVTVTGIRGSATRWSDNTRQAETYRCGRVLLAGDAAHVHSPFSGQGLNLGLGDAANLGWKLAATIQGRAPDGLLDTYSTERHAIGAWVLDWTRAQVALMRGDAKTAQLRAVAQRDLLAGSAAMTRVVALTSGVAQHYKVDGRTTTGVDADAGPSPAVEVGRLLGDVTLTDGSRLADHAHDGRFVLLDRTRDHRHTDSAARWGERIVAVPDEASPTIPDGVLVRPDGVVAWTSAGGDDLSVALRRWAGSPVLSPAAAAR